MLISSNDLQLSLAIFLSSSCQIQPSRVTTLCTSWVTSMAVWSSSPGPRHSLILPWRTVPCFTTAVRDLYNHAVREFPYNRNGPHESWIIIILPCRYCSGADLHLCAVLHCVLLVCPKLQEGETLALHSHDTRITLTLHSHYTHITLSYYTDLHSRYSNTDLHSHYIH